MFTVLVLMSLILLSGGICGIALAVDFPKNKQKIGNGILFFGMIMAFVFQFLLIKAIAL